MCTRGNPGVNNRVMVMIKVFDLSRTTRFAMHPLVTDQYKSRLGDKQVECWVVEVEIYSLYPWMYVASPYRIWSFPLVATR